MEIKHISFLHILVAPGKNVITRNAIDSNVTLSHTYTFEELKAGQGGSQNASEYCSCGWPEHMLLPKGTYKGMDYELFVMATDYTVDSVSCNLSILHILNDYSILFIINTLYFFLQPDGANIQTICSDAVSYCGAKDQRYPDSKPMGFPFDRPMVARSAAELLTDNMTLVDVKIKFLG